MHKKAKDILEEHGLKKTQARIEILKIFLATDYAISANEISQKLTIKPDRVTLFRALNSFVDNGILHKVLGADPQTAYYALYSSECSEHSHVDNHVHFCCISCNHTFCLTNIPIPDIETPEGYETKHSDLTLYGYCPNCRKEK